MLPCVCSVIDHRWCQNVVRTKKWHTRRSQVCHWCSYHILTSSVIYYWIYYWSLFYFKIFQHNAKAGLLPRLCPAFARKKPVDVIYDRFKMKQFHWLLCVAKNRDWSRKIVPLSNLTRASLLDEWKLTAKAELNCEIYKSWRKCWKNQVSFFIGAALWAEKLGRCPENYRSWKNTVGKLVVTVNLEAIWFEFWMRGV